MTQLASTLRPLSHSVLSRINAMPTPTSPIAASTGFIYVTPEDTETYVNIEIFAVLLAIAFVYASAPQPICYLTVFTRDPCKPYGHTQVHLR
jgi:hypothetical protein